MRNTRIAPVENAVMPVSKENLAVVQIVVLDRVGHDADLLGPRPHLRREIPELYVLGLRQALRESDAQEEWLVKQTRVLPRERSGAPVRSAELQGLPYMR